jgi:hypothetical protein
MQEKLVYCCTYLKKILSQYEYKIFKCESQMYTACLWTCFAIDSKLASLQQQQYIEFAEFLPLIYPPEREIKETTDTASSASFLDLYPEFAET